MITRWFDKNSFTVIIRRRRGRIRRSRGMSFIAAPKATSHQMIITSRTAQLRIMHRRCRTELTRIIVERSIRTINGNAAIVTKDLKVHLNMLLAAT